MEVDLTKPLPKILWIDNGGEMVAQKVHISEDAIPLCCKKCVVLGHNEASCPKGRTQQRFDSGLESTKEWVERSFSKKPMSEVPGDGEPSKKKKKTKKRGNKKVEKKVHFEVCVENKADCLSSESDDSIMEGRLEAGMDLD